MQTNRLIHTLFILAAALLSGCMRNQKTTHETSSGEAQPFLAAVQNVEIVQSGAEQFNAIVRGELQDSCTKVDRSHIEQKDNIFLITITAVRQTGAVCSTQPAEFEKIFPISTTGLASGRYLVIANERSAGFVVAAEASPTATPTAEIAGEGNQPIKEPTPTPTKGSDSAVKQPAPTATPTEVIGEGPAVGAASGSAGTGNTQPARPTGCTDNAALIGETVDDDTLFRQGDIFLKTWRLRNVGSCAWDSNYKLIFVHGDRLGGETPRPIPPAAPGETVEVSLDLTAPYQGGQFTSRYLIENASGQRFGINGNGLFWAQIRVNFITPPGAPAPTQVPEFVPGQSACEHQRNMGFESELLARINEFRRSRGLEPLAWQDQLASAALVYSLDMGCNDRVDPYKHTDTQGGRPIERAAAAGYASKVYEIIYYGNPTFGGSDGTPQGAMGFWTTSAIHLPIIMRSDVSEVGIAYVFTTSSYFGGYYTVVFGSP